MVAAAPARIDSAVTTILEPAAIRPADRSRLETLWEHTGDATLRRLLDGEPPFPCRTPRTDRDRIDIVSTCLMLAFRASGDRDVFAMLFELNQHEFVRAIRHYLRYVPYGVDAGDVLQEAALAMYRYPSRFVADGADAFRRWAHRIVRNSTSRVVAREWRQPEASCFEGPQDPPTHDRCDAPDQAVVDRESAALVDRAYVLALGLFLGAFQRLSAREQRLLTLVDIDRRRYRDVATELGSTEPRIKVAVFRARQRIVRHSQRMLDDLAGCTPVEACAASAQ
jgi:RNA polymerase sigma factor (sigma-70 family)